MAWHIKKTSLVSTRTTYYKGDNCWTETYANRSTYSSQANAKAVPYISVSYTHLTLPTNREV